MLWLNSIASVWPCSATVTPNLHRHLIGSPGNTTGFNLKQRRGILDRLFQNVQPGLSSFARQQAQGQYKQSLSAFLFLPHFITLLMTLVTNWLPYLVSGGTSLFTTLPLLGISLQITKKLGIPLHHVALTPPDLAPRLPSSSSPSPWLALLRICYELVADRPHQPASRVPRIIW